MAFRAFSFCHARESAGSRSRMLRTFCLMFLWSVTLSARLVEGETHGRSGGRRYSR